MRLMSCTGKKICLFALGIIFLFSGVAFGWQRSTDCVEGNGNTAEEQRSITGFDKVAIHGSFTVKIVAGTTFHCVVRGDSNLLKHVVTKVNAHELIVDTNKSLCMKQPLEIELQLPDMVRFFAEGAHDVTIKNLHEKSFSLVLDGANMAVIDGEINQFKLDISGTSTLDAQRLQAQQVNVTAAGTTSAKVKVYGKLTVTASGIAEVLYAGTPTAIKSNLSGLAEIAPMD